MDIRMEDFYWKNKREEEIAEARKSSAIRQHRKYSRWLGAARKVLLVELAVILFEGAYRFGYVIRGYNSFGGESLFLMALAAFSVYKLRELMK